MSNNVIKFSKKANMISLMCFLLGVATWRIAGASSFETMIAAVLYGIYGLLIGSMASE